MFYGDHDTLPVSESVLDDFLFIHSDRGQQNRLSNEPNDDLKFLVKHIGKANNFDDWRKKGRPIPVFFLTESDHRTVRAIGLAMLFRLAYKHSVGDAARHAQPNSAGKEDLADRIFGRVSDKFCRKGRVWVGDANIDGDPILCQPVKARLGTPKASYYPNYVEQGVKELLPSKVDVYTTWQDRTARPRGWKRVPPRQRVSKPPRPLTESVATTFQPWSAPRGLVFKLRFHNLNTIECATTIILACSATTILACWSKGVESSSRRPRVGLGG